MSLPSKPAISTPIKLPETQRATSKAEHPLDARFRRLKSRVLPESPYILHVRTTYRQSPEHANLWRIGTHFDSNEEELQYLTFKDRTNDLTPGLLCRGGWDDGKGGIAPPEEPHSRTSSDGTPLQGQGQKKKISLADYNKRDRNKAALAPTKPESPKLKEQQHDGANLKGLTANVEAQRPLQLEPHGQKRSADAMKAGENPNAFEQRPAVPSAKPRSTPEPPNAASVGSLKVTPQRTNIEVGLIKGSSEAQRVECQDSPKTEKPPKENQPEPRKVAPKETNEPINMHCLPPMLSPTLPSEIEEELAKLIPGTRGPSGSIAKSKSSNSSSKIKPQKRNRTGSSTDEEGAKADVGGVAFASSKTSTPASTKSVNHQQSQPQVTSAPRQADNKTVSSKLTPTKSNGLLVSPVTAPVRASTTPQRTEKRRLRHVMRIKKKTNRKNLAQYLRLPPTPGKYPHIRRPTEYEQHSRTPRSEPKNSSNLSILHDNRLEKQAKSKGNDPEAPKAGNKRRRSPDRRDDPELPAKRHKTPGWVPQSAHTPKQLSTSSPALPNFGSAQKPQLLTPKADTKSAPMLRVESAEGSTTTPRGLALNGTPTVTDAGNRRNSVTSSGGRKPIISQDVKRDANKYLNKATDLKHASDVFLKDISNMSDSERKQGVMIGTESVLCYILAFTIFDEPQRQFGQHGNIDGWKSMLRLLDLINREAQPFKHLAGLLLQLEGIIRDYIVGYCFHRLDYNPLEQKINETASADPAKTKEEWKAAAYHTSFHEFRRCFERSQNAWRSGLDLLKVSDIESEYPLTWAKRERQLLLPVKSTDAVIQGEYQRRFNLPMGSMTSGLQAVSFGMSFLEEWSKKNGVKWEPKLEL